MAPPHTQVVEALKRRLSQPRRRQLFQQHLNMYNPERISVAELRRGLPPDKDLLTIVNELTGRTIVNELTGRSRGRGAWGGRGRGKGGRGSWRGGRER